MAMEEIQVLKRGKLVAAAENLWRELAIDVLELILKRLVFVDIVRFKAVCRNWNMAAGSYISSPSYSPLPQIPLLMLRTESDIEKGKFDLYSRIFLGVPDKSAVYKVKDKFEGFPKSWQCVGSSYGWLAVSDGINWSPQLVNPFSGVKIQLPLPDTNTFDVQKNPITKLVLSSDPSRSKTFSVAVRYGVPDRLAFLKYGDDAWTFSRSDFNEHYLDIICHGGKIYGLFLWYAIHIWEFHSLVPTRIFNITQLCTIEDQFVLDRNLDSRQIGWGCYLMESLGELFIVEHVRRATGTYSTIGFIVCKLDPAEENVCIPLQTLGSRAILLGCRTATCVSTQDFPELEENSIYFADAHEHDVLVYNLKDERIHKCGYKDGIINVYSADWLVPNPW